MTGLKASMIELGEVRPGSQPDLEAPGRPLRRIEVRRALAVAVTALCLVGVTGSERPDEPGMPVLWSIPFTGETFSLTEDSVVTIEAGLDTTLTGYQKRTGRLLWERELPAYTGWFSTESAGLVLLPATDPAEGQDQTPRTTALDAVTGELRWSSVGDVSFADATTVLLYSWGEDMETDRRLRLARAADGSSVWEMPLGDGRGSWTTAGPVDSPPTRLITVDERGRVEVRRWSDRSLVTTGTVPWLTGSEDESHAHLYGVGRIVMVIRSIREQQEILAYDVESMTRLWHVRAGVNSGLSPCGPVVCVNTDQGGIEALDPHSGRRVWHLDGYDFARPLRNGMLAVQRRGDGSGALVDPADGRVTVSLRRLGNVVELSPDRLLVIYASTGLQPTALLGELDPDGEVRVRDSAGGFGAAYCEGWDDLLACADPGTGRLTVRDAG